MKKTKFPVAKEFRLKETEEGGLAVCTTDEPSEGMVAFRQALTREVELRTGLVGKRKWMAGEEGAGLIMADDTNWDTVARTEVFLTIEGTDVESTTGITLEFVKEASVTRVKDRKTFDAWWESLDPKWSRFLHARCLEVNPDFDPKS